MPDAVEERLLARLWERPDDRQALGVYADWLAEHGESTRAEYVQLSLLERPSAAQEARRLALLRKHRGAWLGASRPYVWTWEESEETPGFVARCQCSMAKLTEGFELVRSLGPRLVVSVTAPKAKREVAAFAERPLGTLYGLALYEADAQWITDVLLATIAPKLDGLRKLVLHAGEARASEAGWRALLPHLGALEHLELSMGDSPERWLDLLIDSAPAHSLQTLSIPGWIDDGLRGRVARGLPGCALELRDEGRMRFNRETGYYE